jgi:hypothetical protein
MKSKQQATLKFLNQKLMMKKQVELHSGEVNRTETDLPCLMMRVLKQLIILNLMTL